MDKFFKRMQQTRTPSEDSIWIALPDEIRLRLADWRTMLVSAVPVLKLKSSLKINLIDGLFAFQEDLRTVMNWATRTTPMQAMLTHLKVVRLNQNESALVIGVDCPELQDLRRNLSDTVAHSINTLSARWEPTIEIASFDVSITDLFEVEQLQAFGIAGEKFIIDHLHAGLPDSSIECAFLGHSPLQFTDGTTPSPYEAVTVKASGMSTVSGEAGGFLAGGTLAVDIEEDEDDDDEDDDAWMNRARGLSEFLDSGY